MTTFEYKLTPLSDVCNSIRSIYIVVLVAAFVFRHGGGVRLSWWLQWWGLCGTVKGLGVSMRATMLCVCISNTERTKHERVINKQKRNYQIFLFMLLPKIAMRHLKVWRLSRQHSWNTILPSFTIDPCTDTTAQHQITPCDRSFFFP